MTTTTRHPTINWQKQLTTLERYVSSKKWTVRYLKKAKNDWADWERKRISLKKRANQEILFYIFLHELGHMLLFQNGRAYSSKYEEVFDEFTGGTQPVSIARIEEELEAWRTGARLAKRLKLKTDRRNFEKVKSKYVMTYIRWAHRKITSKNNSVEAVEKTNELSDQRVAQEDNITNEINDFTPTIPSNRKKRTGDPSESF